MRVSTGANSSRPTLDQTSFPVCGSISRSTVIPQSWTVIPQCHCSGRVESGKANWSFTSENPQLESNFSTTSHLTTLFSRAHPVDTRIHERQRKHPQGDRYGLKWQFERVEDIRRCQRHGYPGRDVKVVPVGEQDHHL
jgi:hypothetical protein